MKTQSDFVDPNEGAPEKGKALPPVGNYDVAYTDPGQHVADINGELRSSFLVYPADGKIPAMTDEGRKLRAAMPRRLGTGFDNPEERGLSERCIIIGNAGPPLGQYLYNNNFQIVQTDDYLMLESEMIHDVRIAKIGGEHRDDSVVQWHGDSVARWEGDTLVVETRNVNATQRSVGGTFLSKDGTLTERFTRVNDRQILYAFEINDPKVYSSVWRGEMPLNQHQRERLRVRLPRRQLRHRQHPLRRPRERPQGRRADGRRKPERVSAQRSAQPRILRLEDGAHACAIARRPLPASPHPTGCAACRRNRRHRCAARR